MHGADCLVTSNRAFGGGGLLVSGEATNARVEDCTIADNVVDESGGGVTLYNNSLGCLDRCVIRNNVASNGGGGVWLQHGGAISNCWITNNRVTDTNGYGGGVLMDSGGQTGTAGWSMPSFPAIGRAAWAAASTRLGQPGWCSP